MKKLLAVVNSTFRVFVDLDIRVKIVGLAIGSVLLCASVVTMYIYSITSRNLNNELASQSTQMAEDLAEKVVTPLLTDDVFLVYQLIEATLQNNPMVRYVFILDTSGNVQYHSFGKGFPAGLAAANEITPSVQTRMKILATDEGAVWDVATTILNGRGGTIRIGLSDKQKKSILIATIGEQLLVTVSAMTIGIIIALLLGSFISAQIKALAQAAATVASGKVGHQVKIFSRDDLGRLAKAFNTMSTNLAKMKQKLEQREALRRQLLVKVIKAQEEERLRVARELHDNLGQSLSSLGYGLQSLSLALDTEPAKVKPLLRSLYKQNLCTQNELRATIYAMRPSVLDDLGLIPALRSYSEKIVAARGINVNITAEGKERRLPLETETAIFRIAQEALNNILRHSGAKKVQVNAIFGDEEIYLDILDDGRGFDANELQTKQSERAIGILGMHERAELLEGWVKVISKPGQGCRVVVYIPVAKIIKV